MNDTNERSVASAGSVAGGNDLIDRLSDLSGNVGRWGGKTIGEAIAETERLREAIRRLAEQDATLSVMGGNVTVTMDTALTDAEREAVACALAYVSAAEWEYGSKRDAEVAATLYRLLERTKR